MRCLSCKCGSGWRSREWGPSRRAGRSPRCSFPRLTSWRRLMGGSRFLLSFPWSLSLCYLLGARRLFLGQAWAEGKGALERAAIARTADRKRTVHNLAMISPGRMKVLNKPKKKKGRVLCHDACHLGSERYLVTARFGRREEGMLDERRNVG